MKVIKQLKAQKTAFKIKAKHTAKAANSVADEA